MDYTRSSALIGKAQELLRIAQDAPEVGAELAAQAQKLMRLAADGLTPNDEDE